MLSDISSFEFAKPTRKLRDLVSLAASLTARRRAAAGSKTGSGGESSGVKNLISFIAKGLRAHPALPMKSKRDFKYPSGGREDAMNPSFLVILCTAVTA